MCAISFHWANEKEKIRLDSADFDAQPEPPCRLCLPACLVAFWADFASLFDILGVREDGEGEKSMIIQYNQLARPEKTQNLSQQNPNTGPIVAHSMGAGRQPRLCGRPRSQLTQRQKVSHFVCLLWPFMGSLGSLQRA